MPSSARASSSAVLALGGSLVASALLAAGYQAACIGGVACVHSKWLFLPIVPLATIAHLMSCAAVAADRATFKRKWYPRASVRRVAKALISGCSAVLGYTCVHRVFH
ncbi:hypothetical protein CC85DRAFT_285253 [Cutaneotrichosporon oleaginosum]|uniref:Uncharacterized protein n=1 Tax=Cutaneotrichosporon oleaginosum TaxID=879819 RepID=A0A0J0XNR3_9TREE|nr:uncharacterized protein CC85DRAFT_285253 [Cutaneotrichosporon oleaginosum]KLT42713.1 hypothetical protein CC85DRAFT_285253 [Cutaneotrichosporon oleaginosum]TXT09568.1 hypothetical protein COLE_03502 [Cutaneotrichosporon oleaginosum]